MTVIAFIAFAGREAAARRVLYDKAGTLRERLMPAEILNLWLPRDGTEATTRLRNALRGVIRAAITKNELPVERDADRKEVRDAPPAGWAGGYSSEFSLGGGVDLDELYRATAPRSVTIQGAEWITRVAFKAWLIEVGQWLNVGQTALAHWWPGERFQKLKAKDLISEVARRVNTQGISQTAADKQVSAEYGFSAKAIAKARSEQRTETQRNASHKQRTKHSGGAPAVSHAKADSRLRVVK